MQIVQVGDYQADVHQIIGEGAFGEVYRGSHSESGKNVAVKLMRGGLNDQPDAKSNSTLKQRLQEMLGSGRQCENIVFVYSLGTKELSMYGREKETIAWCVMEYVNSGSLLDAVDENSSERTVANACNLLLQLKSGLAHLNRFNIHHHNIKPENILIHHNDENNPDLSTAVFKLTDFSIKSIFQPSSIHTMNYYGISFIAPEACLENYKTNSDIWSIGSVVFNFLAADLLCTPKDSRQYLQTVRSRNFEKEWVGKLGENVLDVTGYDIHNDESKEWKSLLNLLKRMLKSDHRRRMTQREFFEIQNVTDCLEMKSSGNMEALSKIFRKLF